MLKKWRNFVALHLRLSLSCLSLCQVRFSANLPPTRQSRFGPEEEEEEEEDEDGEGFEEGKRVHSPDNQQLLRGSAASHGFRSVCEPQSFPPPLFSLSLSHYVNVCVCIGEGRSTN